MSNPAPSPGLSSTDVRGGLIAALTAYVLWGFLPVYFHFLGLTDPFVILSHRIVWSVPTVLVLLAFAGRLGDLGVIIRQPRALFALLGSALLIAINWSTYIWAVTHHRVLDASLGYFINPLVSFLIAALVFGERFRPLQIAGFALAAVGVINQAVVVGEMPWIALALAVSFAVYGAIRKQVAVDARTGFAVEAIWLLPAAGIFLALQPVSVALAGGEPGMLALLALAGPLTAAPLILFAHGARRLRLSTVAILQYLAPTIQFGIGLMMGEAFTLAHAITFGLIWGGVALFTLSAWRTERRASLAAATPAAAIAPTR